MVAGFPKLGNSTLNSRTWTLSPLLYLNLLNPYYFGNLQCAAAVLPRMHWNVYFVLMLGRVLAGAGTSILFSCFDTCTARDHRGLRQRLGLAFEDLALKC